MTLNVAIAVNRGDFTLDAQIRVAPGETLALLGPNGAGKSTMLAAIAGLLTPLRGVIEVGGRTVTRMGEPGQSIEILPHLRRIGLLGRDPLLFPHLSVLENVAFGPRARRAMVGMTPAGSVQKPDPVAPRVSVSRAREHAHHLLSEVGLAGFSARKPAELSGGQQQRVAIARALAAEPDVLLLDEPMAALDVETAALIRTLLRERLAAANIATVIVTHDVVDALVLADRVAILDNGRLVDVGDVTRVLGQPVNRFAATLAGLNLLEGTMEVEGIVRTKDGRCLPVQGLQSRGVLSGSLVSKAEDQLSKVQSSAGQLSNAEDTVTTVFPPSAVRLRQPTSACDDEDPLSWTATVARIEPAARGVRVTFHDDTVVAEHSAAELLAHGIREGATVTVSVEAAFIAAYQSQVSGNPDGMMGS